MNSKTTLKENANNYLIHTKEKEGITLIALVITIIILLILAGVSINMLFGDNGILKQAIKAKENTIISEEKEQIEMAYVSATISNLNEDVTEENLRTELDKILGDSGKEDENKKTEVTTNTDESLNVLFRKTFHNYNVNNNGMVTYKKTADDSNLSTILTIGDYVNYTYDIKDTGYQIEASLSGYTENQTILQPENPLKWQVYDIDEKNNKIELISEKTTGNTIYFNNALGYNNGVYLINDICKQLYSNSSLGIEARSFNIIDFEEKLNNEGILARNDYSNSISLKYNEGKVYDTSKNSFYPIIEGKKLDRSSISALTTETYTQSSDNILNVNQSYYYLENLENYLKEEDYSLICIASGYWVATRYVDCRESYALFGICGMSSSNNIGGHTMIRSDKYANYNYAWGLRPIVIVDMSILNNDCENIDGVWQLKH